MKNIKNYIANREKARKLIHAICQQQKITKEIAKKTIRELNKRKHD